jgi:hypothetical protein
MRSGSTFPLKRSGSSDTARVVALALLALAVGGPANAAPDTYRVYPNLSSTEFAVSHRCAACEWADTGAYDVAVRIRMVLAAVK